jgi:hypothetical protein
MEPEHPQASAATAFRPREAARGPARRGSLRLWLSGVLAGMALSGAAALVSPGGPSLVSIVSPRAGQIVGLDGVELMVRVPDDGRVVPQSLRVYLNGADVTHQVTTGQNGAVGRLHGLLDGENVLRIEVEAGSWWFDDRQFAAGREVRFLRRRPLDLDRG